MLTDGVSYDYYFQVFDNDVLHNFKSSKSAVYSFRKLTQDEIENEQLQNQDQSIKALDKSLENMMQQDKTLEEISKIQKEGLYKAVMRIGEEKNWFTKFMMNKVIKFLVLQSQSVLVIEISCATSQSLLVK